VNENLTSKYIVVHYNFVSQADSIMIVDNDEDTTNLFTEVLRFHGYNTYGYTNPLEALDIIKDHYNEFVMVIADYSMPSMTGCELGKRIQEINNQIKIILITAHNHLIDNPLKFHILHKPIYLETLKNIVYKTFEENEETHS
jgi:DNA-binding NtrC family response regulator